MLETVAPTRPGGRPPRAGYVSVGSTRKRVGSPRPTCFMQRAAAGGLGAMCVLLRRAAAARRPRTRSAPAGSGRGTERGAAARASRPGARVPDGSTARRSGLAEPDHRAGHELEHQRALAASAASSISRMIASSPSTTTRSRHRPVMGRRPRGRRRRGSRGTATSPRTCERRGPAEARRAHHAQATSDAPPRSTRSAGLRASGDLRGPRRAVAGEPDRGAHHRMGRIGGGNNGRRSGGWRSAPRIGRS